ncbi:membrane protein insertion efficiency factor YidD [Saccharomonospora sp. CUA-673]|uniref:membrane protein insertion efficiency factor YidD n=1 Tax=Saccharomonospora sp. CUA-673 TaxID=1904969 RepID=UPI00095CBE59|nr:membrane protein insertion efficiency factor YidD [Saccharomonospora sp. CUA-673]OLT40728.1 membrane protein insertion efficiency factor YidD [Saccharomonospora sp. CUA-673]
MDRAECQDETTHAAPRPTPVAWILLLPIRFYRKAISPFLPPMCRFHPSCSTYAAEALTKHGAARGTYLAVRRLLRCVPWIPPGRDPVPEKFSFRRQSPGMSTEE